MVAYRQFFSAAGAAGAWIIGLIWFFSDDRGGRLAADNYPPFAIALAILMVATIWYSAFGTQKEIPFLIQPAPRPKSNPIVRMCRDLVEGFRNRSFTWLFSGVLIIYAMVGVNSVLDLYMFQYFWDLAGGEILQLQMTAIGGLLIGAFLTAPLLRRTDKRFGVVLGALVWAACQVVPVVMRLVDALPANGNGRTRLDTDGLQVRPGPHHATGTGGLRFDDGRRSPTSMSTRRACVTRAYSSAPSPSRARQLPASATSSAASASTSSIGPRGVDIQTSADVPAETIANLGILFGPGVAVLSVIAVWCFTRYKLTRARHAEILVALNARRRES